MQQFSKPLIVCGDSLTVITHNLTFSLCKGQCNSQLARFLVFFLLAISIPVSLKGQAEFLKTLTPNPNTIKAEQFLGRDAVFTSFDIEIDPKGYVYFCGPQDLWRFNGSKAQEVPHARNLPTITGVSFHKDYAGGLWFTDYTGGIGYIKNDTAHNFPLPKAIAKQQIRSIEALYLDSSKTLHFAPRGDGYYRMTDSSNAVHVVKKDSTTHGFIATTLEDGMPFHFSLSAKGKEIGVYYMYADGRLKLLHQTEEQFQYESSLVTYSDGSHMLSIGNKTLVHFKEDSLIAVHKFEHKVIKLFIDSEDNLWIGTVNMGTYKASDRNLVDLEHYWSAATAALAEDSWGGIWFKASRYRFQYLPPTDIKCFTQADHLPNFFAIRLIVGDNQQTFFLNGAFDILQLRNDSLFKIPSLGLPQLPGQRINENFSRSLAYDSKNKHLWSAHNKLVARWDGKEWTKFELEKEGFRDRSVRVVKVTEAGKLFGATRTEVFTIEGDSAVAITSRCYGGISALAVTEEEEIWVTGQNGVWVSRDTGFVRPFDTLPELLTGLGISIWATNGAIFTKALKTSPLHRIDNEGVHVVRNSEGEPVIEGDYAFASNGDLWGLSGINGEYLTRVQHENSTNLIEYFGFDDFAALSATGAFFISDSMLYWGSQGGVFMQNLNELKPEVRNPKTVINALFINHKMTPVKSFYSLSHDENYINIDFDALSFRTPTVQFRYRMEGLDSVWVTTEHREAQYTSLPHGDYKFVVQSRIAPDSWGQEVAVDFSIQAPFWKTWWFISGSAIALVLLMFAALKLRISQVTKREEEKSQIAVEMSRLELKAVKAQLNPHFIFNSIGSVMYYLSKNQPKDAQSYLQRFSVLIRSVLDNSEKAEVALEDEIKMMRHYISLESERFEGSSIEFMVESSGVTADQVLIPPALFQPYIENAIWHGLQYSNRERWIRLVFKKEDNQITFEITDNGVGRNASAKLGTSREKERSYGMMIASRKIEALNLTSSNTVEISDLTDADGVACGTRVRFSIPWKNRYRKTVKSN